jgi:outer membrane protein assembly factor BamB
MKTSLSLLSFLALLILSVSPTQADNWSHWRGVNGNGVAPDATPPTEWSNSKNVKWKAEIEGKGSGSPIIWDDKVYVVTGAPTGGPTASSPVQGRGRGRAPALQLLEFKLICFNRADGKRLWEQVATKAKPHENTHSTNNFASASPCTDGQHVYAHFGSRGLYCYTMDGELKWKKTDFEPMQTRNEFGEGSSPTIVGDKIIVPYDHEGNSFLYCLNKTTGEEIWKTPRDEPTNWSTPLIVEHEGKFQIVMNGQNNAAAYDLETGKELWHCGGQTQRPAASAVAADGIVVVTSGFRGSFLGAFQPDGSGNIENTKHVAWTLDRDTPDIASPLLSGNRLYFYKAKNGILSCHDLKSGKRLFGPIRVPGLKTIYASPIAANGHVFLTDREGTTVVIKDADEFEVVASNSVGETVDATPAPVDDQLFIRGERHLFCIQ